MCGIAGIINLNGEFINPNILQVMTDSISHRGPDGEGFWSEENIGFGHRRLAIIDLSDSGRQPMQTINSQYVLYQLLIKHKFNCNKGDFNILKTTDRQTFHDDVCKELFNHLGWNFKCLF